MKNTAGDLQNHLIAQLERLSEENISEEKLEAEIKRSQAIASVAKQAIDNGRLVYDAQKLVLQAKNHGIDLTEETMPPMITNPKAKPLPR